MAPILDPLWIGLIAVGATAGLAMIGFAWRRHLQRIDRLEDRQRNDELRIARLEGVRGMIETPVTVPVFQLPADAPKEPRRARKKSS